MLLFFHCSSRPPCTRNKIAMKKSVYLTKTPRTNSICYAKQKFIETATASEKKKQHLYALANAVDLQNIFNVASQSYFILNRFATIKYDSVAFSPFCFSVQQYFTITYLLAHQMRFFPSGSSPVGVAVAVRFLSGRFANISLPKTLTSVNIIECVVFTCERVRVCERDRER